MAEKTYPMTLAEKEKLEKELEELKLVRRPEVVERIKIARSYGDLSENSEYEAAKDEQAFVEGQISSLETKIRYAEIVNSDSVAQDEVAIGKTVTIQEIGEDEEEVYIIVGSAVQMPLQVKCQMKVQLDKPWLARKQVTQQPLKHLLVAMM